MKKILITGAGKGKSHLAQLLAADYASKGIDCAVLHLGSQREVGRVEAERSSHVIVVTSFPVAIAGACQTITVDGDYLSAAR